MPASTDTYREVEEEKRETLAGILQRLLSSPRHSHSSVLSFSRRAMQRATSCPPQPTSTKDEKQKQWAKDNAYYLKAEKERMLFARMMMKKGADDKGGKVVMLAPIAPPPKPKGRKKLLNRRLVVVLPTKGLAHPEELLMQALSPHYKMF